MEITEDFHGIKFYIFFSSHCLPYLPLWQTLLYNELLMARHGIWDYRSSNAVVVLEFQFFKKAFARSLFIYFLINVRIEPVDIKEEGDG